MISTGFGVWIQVSAAVGAAIAVRGVKEYRDKRKNFYHACGSLVASFLVMKTIGNTWTWYLSNLVMPALLGFIMTIGCIIIFELKEIKGIKEMRGMEEIKEIEKKSKKIKKIEKRKRYFLNFIIGVFIAYMIVAIISGLQMFFVSING
jgi:Na+/H+ antiporter NhaD/arsenite permease-like protein